MRTLFLEALHSFFHTSSNQHIKMFKNGSRNMLNGRNPRHSSYPDPIQSTIHGMWQSKGLTTRDHTSEVPCLCPDSSGLFGGQRETSTISRGVNVVAHFSLTHLFSFWDHLMYITNFCIWFELVFPIAWTLLLDCCCQRKKLTDLMDWRQFKATLSPPDK